MIEFLFKENLIDKDYLRVEIQGGNVSCLQNFEQIADIFIKNCNNLNFLMYTNGIKYLPIFDKIAHLCDFVISLDAGTKETFFKIKQVDVFEQTIENIKRISVSNKKDLKLKYIVVKDVNDNEQELNKFLDVVGEIGGISSIILDIDYSISLSNFTVPKHYYNLFNIAEKYSESNNIRFEVCDFTKKILDDGFHKI